MRNLWCAVLAWLMLALVWAPGCAHAENLGPGGGTRVIAGDDSVGPYRLFITASPEPAYTGQVTFMVRITDPKTGEKVKDAAVRVLLALPESGAQVEAAATHQDAGSAVDYAAHLQIAQPGQYDGVIHVAASQGPAELRFTQRVLSPRTTSALLILALPFVAVLLILGGFWYFRSGVRPGSQHGPPS
jgi:hypothetical protein